MSKAAALVGVGFHGKAGADHIIKAAQEQVGDGFAAQDRRRHSQDGIDPGGHGVGGDGGGFFGVPFRGGGGHGQFIHVHSQGVGQGGDQIT